MEDEMLFCQKCGTKVAEPSTVNIAIKGYENAHSAKNDIAQGHSDKPRKNIYYHRTICTFNDCFLWYLGVDVLCPV